LFIFKVTHVTRPDKSGFVSSVKIQYNSIRIYNKSMQVVIKNTILIEKPQIFLMQYPFFHRFVSVQ